MSTVLWANQLHNGISTSDQSDKYALYKHLDKLDGLCKSLGIPLLSKYCDDTDLRFNNDVIDLPEGMESSDELMARDGVWIDAAEAVRYLTALLEKITSEKTKFGLLRNDHDAVVEELNEAAAFARAAAAQGGKFNFCIVM